MPRQSLPLHWKKLSSEPSGLIARLAANGAVQERVVDALQAIFTILEKCAKRRTLQGFKEALSCSLLDCSRSYIVQYAET